MPSGAPTISIAPAPPNRTCTTIGRRKRSTSILNRYSLGTKDKTLKYNADGSLTLYAGAKSPGQEKKSNWLPAPNGTFSLYIRAYWADQHILDGQWKPPAVEKVNDAGGRALQ